MIIFVSQDKPGIILHQAEIRLAGSLLFTISFQGGRSRNFPLTTGCMTHGRDETIPNYPVESIFVGFHKLGDPRNAWFIMEHPFKMDELGVPPCQETFIYLSIYQSIYIYTHVYIYR